MSRPPLAPFTRDTASQQMRLAEIAWNARDPARAEIDAFVVQTRQRARECRLELGS